MVVTWDGALGWRLRRHFLAGQGAGSIEDVVSRLIAVPASADPGTAIGLRLRRPGKDEMASAATDGRIFATYAFRGTAHYLTPASAAIHLALRCAGRQWELPSWRRHYQLEPGDWPRLRAAVRDALRDGPLSQRELAAAVSGDPAYRHLRSAFEDKSHTLLKPFGWQGDLCFGPPGNGLTFRALDSVPGWNGLAELEDAGPRAVLAYLSAYGPATVERIHYWLGEGLSAGRARITRWIDRLGGELATVPIEGTPALCRAEDMDDIARSSGSGQVVFLPGSDQWVLGAGTSDDTVVPVQHRRHASRGANLVVVGGRVCGTWKIERDAVHAHWFDGCAAEAQHVAAGLEQLGGALGRELRISPS